MKKFIAFVLFLALAVIFIPWLHSANAAPNGPPVKVAKFWLGQDYFVANDKKVDMDVAPYVDENSRTLVPLRFMANSLGIADSGVQWDDKNQTATIASGSTLKFTVGSKDYSVNGSKLQMDTTPVLNNDRVMLPARYVAEALGFDVLWNGAAQTVTAVPHEDNAANKPEGVRVVESVLGLRSKRTADNRWDIKLGDNCSVIYRSKGEHGSFNITTYPRYTTYYKSNYPGLKDVDFNQFRPLLACYFPNNYEELCWAMADQYNYVQDIERERREGWIKSGHAAYQFPENWILENPETLLSFAITNWDGEGTSAVKFGF